MFMAHMAGYLIEQIVQSCCFAVLFGYFLLQVLVQNYGVGMSSLTMSSCDLS